MEWVTTPLLVSAIANLILGVILAAFCVGIRLLVLSVVEFIHYSRSDSMPLHRYVDQSRKLAVAEWIGGLLSWVSLLCGIVNFINAGKLKRRLEAGS